MNMEFVHILLVRGHILSMITGIDEPPGMVVFIHQLYLDKGILGCMQDFHEVIPSIDDGELEDQLAVVEYVKDIYKFYPKIEVCFFVNECSFLWTER